MNSENEKYSSPNLTEKELKEFVALLEDEDAYEAKPMRTVVPAKVPKTVIVAQPDQNKPAPIKLTLAEQAELARQARAEQYRRRRDHAKEIKQKFARENRIDELCELVTKDELQAMIKLAADESFVRATAIKAQLSRVMTKRLRMYIPSALKRQYDENPQAFTKNPGFDYETSQFFGNLKLHIDLDLPIFFSDPSEMDILKTMFSHFLYAWDRQVELYHYHIAQMRSTEVRLAIKYRKVKLVIDLLNLGINHFNAYRIVKGLEPL